MTGLAPEAETSGGLDDGGGKRPDGRRGLRRGEPRARRQRQGEEGGGQAPRKRERRRITRAPDRCLLPFSHVSSSYQGPHCLPHVASTPAGNILRGPDP